MSRSRRTTPRRALIVTLAALVCGALVAEPSAASTAAPAPEPSAATGLAPTTSLYWTDTIGDEFWGPDVRNVGGVLDPADIALWVDSSWGWLPGHAVSFFIDVDRSTATGYLGADVRFDMSVGTATVNGAVADWNGNGWTLRYPQPSTLRFSTTPSATHSLAMVISRAELGVRSRGVHFWVHAGNTTQAYPAITYYDRAPNVSGAYILGDSAVGGVRGPGAAKSAVTLRAKARPKTIKRGKKGRIRVVVRKKGNRRAVSTGTVRARIGKKWVSKKVKVRRGKATLKVGKKHLRKVKRYRVVVRYSGSKTTRAKKATVRIRVRR